jgi:hypothetical protein
LAHDGAHLEHDALDAGPDRKIAKRRTPRRQQVADKNGEPPLDEQD